MRAVTTFAAALALLFIGFASAGLPTGEYCVVSVNATLAVKPLADAACRDSVANATWQQTQLQTGWNTLNIEGNSAKDAELIARGVGYLEGVITAQICADWFFNVLSPNGTMAMTPAAEEYLKANMAATEALVTANANSTDVYWVNLKLVWVQLNGLIDGIIEGGSGLTRSQAFALSAAGDLGDIDNFATSKARQFDPRDLPPAEFARWWMNNTHCSSLVKVTPNLENVFFGHATWANYNMMLRVFKSIRPNFPAGTPGVQANTITYSSWPGALTSVDDFYYTDSGLGVMETSLSIFNFSIYSACKPNQLLSFVRCAVANRIATNGSMWASTFARLNSGTYNNQWMVVDLNLFYPGRDLLPGLLTVVEQLPGIVRSGDVTSILARGYWPSYNIPYFKELFDLAGYPGAVAKQGPEMNDYETCVRARMFAAYQNTVVDAATMQYMMQYNQYTVDPLELGNPTYAIAARADLMPFAPGYFGALDTKFTSYQDLKANNTIYAFAGPTPQQGIFSWSTNPALTALTNTRGLVPQWNFTVQDFHPLK